jgi:hypothetical protein
MPEILFLLFVFVCVSSIFVPELRKLALCLISTVVVIVGGIGLLVLMIHK